MINAEELLADLTRLLKRLEDDLRQRIADVAELKASLQTEWQAARDADRTAETFETWGDQVITQAGVHWLLSCVFLRFIEDNELVERPWLGGTPASGRLALARDRHEAYFREKPLESDRDFLLACFREARALPGLHTFFDEAHNPVFRLGVSGDAAMALRQFWQQVDPNTGSLAHDFTDPAWNTRFLGDLYQDLSEATRKRYALLQTPEFVEEFILDRTLTPAIREFGFRDARMIDPTCGSGHFLLGGFRLLVDEWIRHEPARNPRDIAQRALDAVAGVDLNPFAVAISRFRLLVAALKISAVHRLSEAPDFRLNVAIGDSLLHGKRFGMTATDGMFEDAEYYAGSGLGHAYASEDLAEVQRILGRQYHAVVGNPPYIVVRDAALNAAYRQRYVSCHMKYSLGAPFTERFFDLAVTGIGRPAGYVGLITANSFMKREFGSKLIEEFFPTVDLTHVIDTSGAYIPGHGTPTVILFGRMRRPVSDKVRMVLGISGEPGDPADPSKGRVWLAIMNQVDSPSSESQFVSVTDFDRSRLSKHPWALGGGGAAELKELIESAADAILRDVVSAVGIQTVTLADELFVADSSAAFKRHRVPAEFIRPMVSGDGVRDWQVACESTLFPYDSDLKPAIPPNSWSLLWPGRVVLSGRLMFQQTQLERGLTWFEFGMFNRSRYQTSLIVLSEVATHNHFAMRDDTVVLKQTAPCIRLHRGEDESFSFGLLGVLNSSVGCFWLKQVAHNKGSPVDTRRSRLRPGAFEYFYQFNATTVAEFPIPRTLPSSSGRQIHLLAQEYVRLQTEILGSTDTLSAENLAERKDVAAEMRRRMISLQEELDWSCYSFYGLGGSAIVCPAPPAIKLGERAFEIVLARRMTEGKEETTWFARHGSTPITELPVHWPADYRALVEQRIALIESDRDIGLIERPEYKRRWNTPAWDAQDRAALREWLLDRLEAPQLWPASAEHPRQLATVNRLADAVRTDAVFMQIAELYAGHSGFDVTQVVAELVAGESVPFLPVLRYSDTGLRKRAQWEDTWALQRRQDAGENVRKIPVPPKYQSKDFVRADFWRLRGGFDVPKERWVSYPGCERGADTSLPIAWAGWNHLQQATALAAYYLEMKDTEGWEPIRLQPLLAGLLELVPWLEQWHNDIDPAYGERMGTYYRSFVNEEARALGFTVDDLRAWKPAVTAAKRGRKKVAQIA